MTSRALLVFVSARTLAATAALLALAAALISCGNAEEELLPGTTTPPVSATSTATPAVTAEPSSAAIPSGWQTYVDPQLHFSIAYPDTLSNVTEETVSLTGGGKQPEAKMRILTFRSTSGARALDIGMVGNPGALPVQAWMDAYDPCASDFDAQLPQRSTVVIAARYAGVLCPVDQLNQVNPRVYAAIGGFVFVFVGNVNGLPDSGQPAGLSQAEFDAILASLQAPE